MSQWLVLGISGVTCGGKTTLSESLCKILVSSNLGIRSCRSINQDGYLFDDNYKGHIWNTEIQHINWEVITALNMDKMYNDVKNIIKANKDVEEPSINVLIVEGFLIFNYPLLWDLCDIKFHIDLTKEQCWARRSVRVYEVQHTNVDGYFEACVWPEYLKYKQKIVESEETIHMLDGTKSNLCDYALKLITQLINANK